MPWFFLFLQLILLPFDSTIYSSLSVMLAITILQDPGLLHLCRFFWRNSHNNMYFSTFFVLYFPSLLLRSGLNSFSVQAFYFKLMFSDYLSLYFLILILFIDFFGISMVKTDLFHYLSPIIMFLINFLLSPRAAISSFPYLLCLAQKSVNSTSF